VTRAFGVGVGRWLVCSVYVLAGRVEYPWLNPETPFPPSLTEQPLTQLAYKLGDLVMLDCHADANPPAL